MPPDVDETPLVLVTGAAGRIGTYLRRGLPSMGWRLRLLDIHPCDDEATVVADIRDPDSLDRAMRGVGAVVHLAGIPTEAPFEEIVGVNIEGTWQVFDAARRAGVERIVYAGSNHAVGFAPRAEPLRVDMTPRPDTNYGVSKAFGEALARFYFDRHHMRVACLRIGSCADCPTNRRMLSTWLSPGDAVRLFDACLRAPNLDFAVVYGVSANTRGWWDLEAGYALGFEPCDDAEAYADDILAAHVPSTLDASDDATVGGRWTTFSPD
jgi:uronate dehydrogenase